MAGLKVITPPATEPVTLIEVKDQLRIDRDDTSLDGTLTPLITAAREWCEGFQNRAYVTQTLELAIDAWPCADKIELPRPPLQNVTSLVYTDSAGSSVTWDALNYVADDYAYVSQLVKAKNVSWPSVSLAPVNGVKIRYMAGYIDVPEKVKQAIILLVNVWFDTPGCPVPDAVKNLLQQDRVIPI